MRRLSHIAVFVVTALLAFSCAEPASREQFVRSSDSVDGTYFFTLEFTDSTAAYDLYLCTRIDGKASELAEVGDFPLRITFISPAGDCFSETAHLPLVCKAGSLRRSHEFVYLYRSGMRQKGVWKMAVYPSRASLLPESLCGFGIQMVRQDG